MSSDINLVWAEFFADISTAIIAWQLIVIAASLLLAWSINGLLRAYVMRHAPENWKVGIGGINRVLFPLSSLLFASIGKFILGQWQHTSMLKFAVTLLLAMAVIRLIVYALRYIFAPSSWVRTTESAVATSIWLILVLHLSGLLPGLVNELDEISFNVGKHPISLLLVIQAVLTVLITLILALWISRVLEIKLMRTEQINMNVRVVLSKLFRIVLSVFAILMALSAVGLDITLLSVFGGALGVGLGFGLQKIANNYVSGFIILLDDSLHLGDVITLDNHYGVVSGLRARYMVLRRLDGTEVVIPNESLITSAVINHSLTDRKTLVQMPIQISYESPLELAMNQMRDVANQHPRVLEEPAAEVKIIGFGESGIDLNLTFWISDPEEGTASLKSAIYLEIWKAFKLHAVSIPYPQREIRILGTIASAETGEAG